MSDTVIKVANLSKRYRIGGSRADYGTLRDTLIEAIRAPARRAVALIKGQAYGALELEEEIWALKNVSLEVRQGEIVGVIGRNGAGKTTLLKILSRITEPTEGYAEIRGRVGSLLEVGTGFHQELTGRENVYLNGAILGMRREEINRKFDEIVAFSEVERFLDTPVKFYSSGMRVRLAFAVAAYLEPEILLVDEVLAVGDIAFQKKCLGKMGDVAHEGRTVLFVSHSMISLQNLCTRGVLLESGELTRDGGINEVISSYLETVREQKGEVCWDSPETAPGDERVRLKAVRVVSDGKTTGNVDIERGFRIEVEYWNLEPDRRRLVSIHVCRPMEGTVLASGNMTSVCRTPDPWFTRPYPKGIFRTTCTIPGNLLNDGLHSITVYINVMGAQDIILVERDVLLFMVQDTSAVRKEYTGKWIGAVRPRLDWSTARLDA